MNAVEFTPSGYRLPTFPFVAPPDLRASQRQRYPIVIVGGGLAGLTLACDLAVRGVRAVVLDEDDTVGVRGASSRGMVYAQKSLEVFDRLGVFARIRDKGITWSVGRTLAGHDFVYEFDAAVASLSLQPPFVNLQQFYLEWFIVDRIVALGTTDLRWKNKVVDVRPQEDCVIVKVETPAGSYELEAQWLVDAGGANSAVRTQLGLDAHPDLSDDRWCICDVRFKKDLPPERWTWVEAPFNGDRAVWQHPMPDDVWRLDYQMGANADPEHASNPAVAAARVREHIGADTEFEMVWVGPWAYRTHLLDDFRHGRVLFVGDAAHVMSPFGARGGNSGIQDAENLAWKLALVVAGQAPERLLDSYSEERRAAGAENIRITRRTSRFLAPQSAAERILRKAAIGLAREYRFARALVNTGRLSAANRYTDLSCITAGGMSLPNVALRSRDAGVRCLADVLRASNTQLLGLCCGEDTQIDSLREALKAYPVSLRRVAMQGSGDDVLIDEADALRQALGIDNAAFVLVRPDAYVAAVFDSVEPDTVRRAVERTLAIA